MTGPRTLTITVPYEPGWDHRSFAAGVLSGNPRLNDGGRFERVIVETEGWTAPRYQFESWNAFAHWINGDTE